MRYPVAPAVTPPRQLAPTVGPAAVLAGVFIRTGSVLPSGKRVVCGLAQQFGSLCFVDDNTGCFGSRPLPASGDIILFGSHQVYVATELPYAYPEKVRVAEDPPSLCAARALRVARPARPVPSVEVMVVAPAAAGAGAGDADAPPPAPAKKSTRTRGPALERVGGNDNEAGPSDPQPRPSRLDVAIENLHQAYVPDADV